MTGELDRRLLDIARASQRDGEPRFSRFLEPPERPLAERAAREAGAMFEAFGGCDGAERVVAGFCPPGAEIGPGEWPIVCLELRWNAKFASAGHRDVLGALMALGVERATMGDIRMGEGCAYLFALREVAGYLAANLDSAGRAHLSVSEIDPGAAQFAEPEGRQFRATLASMRLDALVAEGYDLSRADAQALVRRGLVKLNHLECEKGDQRVGAGDLISVRGHGRLVLVQEGGATKKGRFGVVLLRYGQPRR